MRRWAFTRGSILSPGRVRRFPDKMPDPHRSGRSLRIPQIGWNQLHQQRPDPLLAGVPDGAYGYFAHSYFCDAAEQDAVLTLTDYGVDYPSIVRHRNAWGIQCHPEKSHTVGLHIPAQFHTDCREPTGCREPLNRVWNLNSFAIHGAKCPAGGHAPRRSGIVRNCIDYDRNQKAAETLSHRPRLHAAGPGH